MNKKEQLHKNMKSGLDGLFTPTILTEGLPAIDHSLTSSRETDQKEKEVHCNLVMKKSIHTRLKYMALERGMTLKDIVNQALDEYLERNK